MKTIAEIQIEDLIIKRKVLRCSILLITDGENFKGLKWVALFVKTFLDWIAFIALGSFFEFDYTWENQNVFFYLDEYYQWLLSLILTIIFLYLF